MAHSAVLLGILMQCAVLLNVLMLYHRLAKLLLGKSNSSRIVLENYNRSCQALNNGNISSLHVLLRPGRQTAFLREDRAEDHVKGVTTICMHISSNSSFINCL